MQAEGLDKSIFWRRDQFHLTLVMLKLYSSSEVASVQEIFDDVSRSAAGGPKSSSSELSLSLGGLEIMNDDPAETHVVFVDVEQNAARAKLERVLFTIQERIDAVGLLDRRERQRLFLLDGTFAPKLHATVINTRLRRSGATSTEVSSSGKRQLTPAEMATQGASIAAASGPRSEAGKASANRRSAGLRHEFGERAPVNAGANPTDQLVCQQAMLDAAVHISVLNDLVFCVVWKSDHGPLRSGRSSVDRTS